MRPHLARLCAAVLAAAIAPGAPAMAATAPTTEAIDAVFAGIGGKGPGCAAGVEQNGRTLMTRAWGVADLADGRALSSSTRFYMASVSKQVAALAVLEAVRSGKMDLKASITTYIPELPAYLKDVTLYDLLTHTSGVRDYFALSQLAGVPTDHVFTEAEVIATVSRQKALNFPRGTQFMYSNSGYVLLAIAAQRATGKTFDALAREEIFKPLGMADTFFQHHHDAPVPQKAHGYSQTAGAWTLDDSWLDVVGDGGLYSTVDDMLKWVENLDFGTAGAASLAAMEVPARTTDGKLTGFGMGLEVGETHGLKVVEHGGALAGYRTSDVWFPSEKLGVVVLCNFASADPGTLSHRLAALYLPALADAPAAAAAAPAAPAYTADPAALAAAVGTYVAEGGTAAKIELAGGRLVIAALGAPLVPKGPGAFYLGSASSGRTLVFSPTGFELNLGGRPPMHFARTTPEAPDAAVLASLAGDWASPEIGATWHVRQTPAGFTLAVAEGKAAPLESIGQDRYIATGFGAEVTLVRGPDRSVAGFTVAIGRAAGIAFQRAR